MIHKKGEFRIVHTEARKGRTTGSRSSNARLRGTHLGVELHRAPQDICDGRDAEGRSTELLLEDGRHGREAGEAGVLLRGPSDGQPSLQSCCVTDAEMCSSKHVATINTEDRERSSRPTPYTAHIDSMVAIYDTDCGPGALRHSHVLDIGRRQHREAAERNRGTTDGAAAT